jgi:hypothetical protein
MLTALCPGQVEFRFDDLDLREEPSSGKSDDQDSTVNTCTDLCTRITTSRNTCNTTLC